MTKLYITLYGKYKFSFFCICNDHDSAFEYVKNHSDELIWEAPLAKNGQWMFFGSNPGKHPEDMDEFYRALTKGYQKHGVMIKYPCDDDFEEYDISIVSLSKILEREIDARTDICSVKTLLCATKF